jgi:putative transposase
MPSGRPKSTLVITTDEREQLESIARSRSVGVALNQRAKIVPACADGAYNQDVALRFRVSMPTVGKWRRRFVERRIAGLYDEPRPGAPRSISDETIARLINATLKTKPQDGSTHWSVRSMAAETDISKTSVHRYFRL